MDLDGGNATVTILYTLKTGENANTIVIYSMYQDKGIMDIKDHWVEDEINFVTARVLFQGTSEDLFNPNISMTRGMLVTALYSADCKVLTLVQLQPRYLQMLMRFLTMPLYVQ